MRRIWIATGVGTATGVSAFAVNQLKLTDLSWGWIAVAFAFGAAAAFGALTASGVASSPSWEISDKRGRPPVLRSINDGALGVHPTRFPRVRLPRDADAVLAAAVARDPAWIIVTGPSLAGTSSELARAIRGRWPNRRVLVVFDPTAEQVRAVFRDAQGWARKGYGAVLWIENAARDAMDALDALRQGVGDVGGSRLLIATTTHDPDLPPYAGSVVVHVGVLTAKERDGVRRTAELSSVFPALDAGEVVIGRLLASTHRVQRVLAGEVGVVAVLRCVIDWQRESLGIPLRVHDLEVLAPIYATGSSGSPAVGSVKRTVRSLRRDDGESGRPWILGRPRDGLHPHPLLVAFAHPVDQPDRPPLGWEVPEALWVRAAPAMDANRRRTVGLRLLNEQRGSAAYLLLAGDENVSGPDWRMLGVLLATQGKYTEARDAYQHAIDSGEFDSASRAWSNLGTLEGAAGNIAAARDAYQHAIDFSHPDHTAMAWHNLGRLEDEVGNSNAARVAYQHEAPRVCQTVSSAGSGCSSAWL